MAGDPIEALLADLDDRLRGPRQARLDLLDEARAGLHDAVRRRLREGMSPAEARATAVVEFGDPARLAIDYQAELTAAQGRRNAVVMLLGLPLAAPLWKLLWMLTPRNTTPASASHPWVYDLFVSAACTSAFGALVGLALLACDARRHQNSRIVTTGIAAVCLVAIGMNLCAMIANSILIRTPLAVIRNSPLAVPVYLATVLGLLLGLGAAWRSLRLTFTATE